MLEIIGILRNVRIIPPRVELYLRLSNLPVLAPKHAIDFGNPRWVINKAEKKVGGSFLFFACSVSFCCCAATQLFGLKLSVE